MPRSKAEDVMSPAEAMARRLVAEFGASKAREIVDVFLNGLSTVELAAHEADWRHWWARPNQLPPASNEWDAWSFIAGRGNGKTVALSRFVNEEVTAERVRYVCLMAQDESNSIKLQVLGPSGLIATAPPCARPRWEASSLELVWPNGARAYVRTPEVPGKIRGMEYHLSWLTELQSWPSSSRDEAFMNVQIATRLGYSRIVTDSTPKRRNSLLLKIIANAEREPRHVLVRGTTHDNPYLGRRYIENLEREFGGTQKGKEELLGEMLGDEDAIFRAEWFDRTRRGLPDRYKRRARYIDPAITSDPRHSDSTGVFDMGLGADGQIYAIKNCSGKFRAEEWATASIDAYVRDELDLLWVETNRGGDSHAALLRVIARAKGLELRELAKDETPVRRSGIVNFRGVNTKRQKAARAEGAAALCEKGRVTFARGLEVFEDKLAAFDGSDGGADDDIDAFVHGCHDLAGLAGDVADPRAGFRGLTEANKAIQQPAPSRSVARSFGGGTGGRI